VSYIVFECGTAPTEPRRFGCLPDPNVRFPARPHRADLMAQLEKQIKARKLTQVKAAEILDVTQGRVSDLTRGNVEKFSLDTLVTFAARLGKPAEIKL
jgi:predicted XRE-type DNA-binding protein